jgi:hypothetical protein
MLSTLGVVLSSLSPPAAEVPGSPPSSPTLRRIARHASPGFVFDDWAAFRDTDPLETAVGFARRGYIKPAAMVLARHVPKYVWGF